MREFEDRLATSFEEIRCGKPKYYHDIDTGNHEPIKMQPYRVAPGQRDWQKKENQRLEETGVTIKSESSWGFPCVLAPKKGAEPGQYAPRQCHDYRKLNDITVKDAYPLPLIDDILSLLEPGATYL